MTLISTVKENSKAAARSAKRNSNKQLSHKEQRTSEIMKLTNPCQNLTTNAYGTAITGWTGGISSTGKANKIK